MNTFPPVTRNGLAPGPVSTCTCPIRLSGPHVPVEACPSGHRLTEESIPNSPGGIFSCTPSRNPSPSLRPKASVNGLNPPAWLLVVPAANDGANCGAGQPVTAKALLGVEARLNGALHGVRSAFVTAAPHVLGFASVARGPPTSSSLRCSKGSCGSSGNVVVSRPVRGSIDPVPACLTVIPSPPSPIACRYRRTIRPPWASAGLHGPHSGAPRKTSPSSGSARSGEVICSRPTSELASQEAGLAEPEPNSSATSRGSTPGSSWQTPSPCAAEGEITIPSGSATVTSRTCGVAGTPWVAVCGTLSSTPSPTGSPASVLSGCTASEELKIRFPQPVTGGIGG